MVKCLLQYVNYSNNSTLPLDNSVEWISLLNVWLLNFRERCSTPREVRWLLLRWLKTRLNHETLVRRWLIILTFFCPTFTRRLKFFSCWWFHLVGASSTCISRFRGSRTIGKASELLVYMKMSGKRQRCCWLIDWSNEGGFYRYLWLQVRLRCCSHVYQNTYNKRHKWGTLKARVLFALD